MFRTLAMLLLLLAFFATATRVVGFEPSQVSEREQTSGGFDGVDDDDLIDPALIALLPAAELAQLVREGERLTQGARSLTSQWVDKRLKRPPRS